MISVLPCEIDVDIIIPVPLHPARLRAREFNQSLLLADQLSRHLVRPVSAIHLVRIKEKYFIFPLKSWSRCALPSWLRGLI
jgi:predicted amidophosphoribosyltransferase